MNYDKNCPASIEEMFSSIAEDYDSVNTLASLGLHKLWNRALRKALLKQRTPEVHLDLCAGTGAIGVPLAAKVRKKLKKLHLLDFSKPMLEIALHNALEYGLRPDQIEIHFEDACQIPLPNNSVDTISLAYGIRNIANPTLVIQEIYRVLKPGGVVGILELTCPNLPPLKYLHKLYIEKGMPFLASLMTSNSSAYRYLASSIQEFIPSENLVFLLQSERLRVKSQKKLLGGSATLLVLAKEPLRPC